MASARENDLNPDKRPHNSLDSTDTPGDFGGVTPEDIATTARTLGILAVCKL